MRRKDTKTTGIEPYVICCMAMNLHEDQALQYLDDNGYDISRAELYRLKKEIEENTPQRLNLIASKEFMTQHIQRLDTLNTIQKELWSNYNLQKDPTKRANILMQIAEMQVYLSSYYDSTRYVMQQAAQKQVKEIER